jgi:AraC family ethanolamine operon transcriptional activator
MMAGALSVSEIYNIILHGLQGVIDVGLATNGTISLRPTRRPDLVAQATDLMSASAKLDLTADEIAQTLGVSYRVLAYAFQDTLGVSPYQYLMTEKLHAVRRVLKTSDSSIAEASKSYGFSVPSRFTGQYRRLFGELPSETRKKAARHR